MVIQIPMIRFYNKHELQYKPDIKKNLCEMQTNDIFSIRFVSTQVLTKKKNHSKKQITLSKLFTIINLTIL